MILWIPLLIKVAEMLLSAQSVVFSLLWCSVKQLHREFLRAGSDVMQAFTFYASDDKLENCAGKAGSIGVNSGNTTCTLFLSSGPE